jgi:hypothetical protein
MLEWKLWFVRSRGDWRASSMSDRKRAESITCRGESGIPPECSGHARWCKATVEEAMDSKVVERRPRDPSRVRVVLDFKLCENSVPFRVATAFGTGTTRTSSVGL